MGAMLQRHRLLGTGCDSDVIPQGPRVILGGPLAFTHPLLVPMGPAQLVDMVRPPPHPSHGPRLCYLIADLAAQEAVTYASCWVVPSLDEIFPLLFAPNTMLNFLNLELVAAVEGVEGRTGPHLSLFSCVFVCPPMWTHTSALSLVEMRDELKKAMRQAQKNIHEKITVMQTITASLSEQLDTVPPWLHSSVWFRAALCKAECG